MADDPVEQAFLDASPRDGWRIVPEDKHSVIALSLAMYSHDVIQASELLFEKKKPDNIDRGAMRRLRLLLDAVCRYFTTGGDWPEFETVLSELRGSLTGGLLFPGWHYVDGWLGDDGNFVHLFAKDGDDKAAMWVEDSRIVMTKFSKLGAEQMEKAVKRAGRS